MKEIDCSSVLEQLSDYLDEEARAELCHTIEEHLHRCHDCRVYVDSVRKTIVLYQADSSVEVPMRATAGLRAALAAEYGRDRGRVQRRSVD